jgi:transcription elongation factor Elf1
MYIPKRYGESKTFECPFCGKESIAKNSQGLNVCQDHKDRNLPDIKCVCGSYLDIRVGKFGPYFNCINCGNLNLNKGLELMEMQEQKEKDKKKYSAFG